MTNQVLESAQPVSPAGTPTPASGAVSGQPSSPDIGAVLAELQDLRKQVQGLQSVGDKREAKLAERFTTVEDYLKRAGIQPDQRILRDMQVDEILASRNGQAVVSPGSGAPVPTPQPSVDYEKVIQAVGLDPTDREVWRLAGQHPEPAAFTNALVQLKITRASAPPPSLAAATPAPASGVGSQKPDLSTITDPNELFRLAEADGFKLPGPPKR